MEKILKKVDELASLLEKAIVQEDKRAEENSKMAEDNKEFRSELLAKNKELNAREEAVKPIEDVAVYKAKADQLMLEGKKKMRIASMAQDDVNKANAENRKEYAEQKAIIAREDKRILDEKEGLKKGYAQLNKAKDEAQNQVARAVESAGIFIKKVK